VCRGTGAPRWDACIGDGMTATTDGRLNAAGTSKKSAAMAPAQALAARIIASVTERASRSRIRLTCRAPPAYGAARARRRTDDARDG
jgi:hypothetical protein